jgi:hypothetical protein
MSGSMQFVERDFCSARAIRRDYFQELSTIIEGRKFAGSQVFAVSSRHLVVMQATRVAAVRAA